MRAADTSRNATGNQPVSRQDIRFLKETHGVQLFIPGAFNGIRTYDAIAETMRNILVEDRLIASYIAHTQPGRGVQDVLDSYQVIGESNWRQCRFIAIDAEWPNNSVDNLIAAADKVLTLGQRPILYTAAWCWRAYFDNADFPELLKHLWNAYYDNDPDYDFHRFPFGSDNAVLVGEQYQNSTIFGSYAWDLNEFDDAWVNAGPGTSNGLVALLQAWKDDMADSISGAASLHEDGIAPDRLGLYGIRQTQKAQNWAKILKGGK